METVAPFLEIVEEIRRAGADSYGLCYQCGKCDVVCPWNRVTRFSMRRLIREAALGPDHLRVAVIQNNLGELEREGDRLTYALGQLDQEGVGPTGGDQLRPRLVVVELQLVAEDEQDRNNPTSESADFSSSDKKEKYNGPERRRNQRRSSDR